MKTACWYEGIYVVQVPTKKGPKPDVTLYIDYKGKGKVEGNKEYKQNSKEHLEAIETAYKYAYKRFILQQ